jgi:hypothetical protein
MLGERHTPVAYYLIPKREFVTNSPAFSVDVIDSSVTGEEGWNRVRKSVSSYTIGMSNAELPLA